MICAGIDGGSRAIKIVLLDAADGAVLATGAHDQGVEHERLANQLLDQLLTSCGRKRADLAYTVATGYTRGRISLAQRRVTEITCHAVGVRHLLPQARTIVEIGGQDSKLIGLDEDGSVRDFCMNDRCAAGTGHFLEMVAAKLDVPLANLGKLSGQSPSPAPISSTCVVFAESEIIGLLASGVPPRDIAAGVQASVASRVAAMAGPGAVAPVVLTGGVARIPGMETALACALGQDVITAPQPHLTGALGAAILATQQLV